MKKGAMELETPPKSRLQQDFDTSTDIETLAKGKKVAKFKVIVEREEN